MKQERKRKYYGLNKKESLEKLEIESFNRITVSFYKYIRFENIEALRDKLFKLWNEHNCLGRVYIAHEGINAQMSVPEHYWNDFKKELYSISGLADIPLKIGIHHGTSFYKLHVKVKKQIVTDGLSINDYTIENVGTHLTAFEFNTAMDDKNTIVVDMRNHYESEIGHFKGALIFKVDTFRQELPLVAKKLKKSKDKKIVLYCTGGIRCEKASAYLKHKGFKNVNQLHGGIIDYKHQIEAENLENKFLGSNYVFDERGKEHIGKGIISQCHQCGNPCDKHINCQNLICNLLFIQCDNCAENMKKTCSKKCHKIISMVEHKRKNYYKKHGNNSQRKFSKSLKARKRIHNKSLWRKIRVFLFHKKYPSI